MNTVATIAWLVLAAWLLVGLYYLATHVARVWLRVRRERDERDMAEVDEFLEALREVQS